MLIFHASTTFNVAVQLQIDNGGCEVRCVLVTLNLNLKLLKKDDKVKTSLADTIETSPFISCQCVRLSI